MHLQFPVTKNHQPCHSPVLPFQRHLCLTPSKGNLSVLIWSRGTGKYVKVDSGSCTRGLNSEAIWNRGVHFIVLTLLCSIYDLHTHMNLIWYVVTATYCGEASKDRHWFQANPFGHLLFLVRYTFLRLMSSRLYSLPSEMSFFMPRVRKHCWFITEERWRREKKRKSKKECDG